MLTAAHVLAATGVAASAVVLPLRAGAIVPRPDDLAVGWSLLVGSLLSIRRPSVSACLGGAGFLWVTVGLAPLAPAPAEGVLGRLALFPAALLVCAAVRALPSPRGRAPTFACGLALGAAVLGGLAAGSAALLGISAAALVEPAAVRKRDSASSVILLGLGTGFGLLGLGAAGLVGLPSDLAVAMGVVTLVGGAVAVGWSAGTSAGLDGGALGIEGPVELAKALGRAFGTEPVMVAFPGPGGEWLDPSGRPCHPGEGTCDITDAGGQVLASTRPELRVEPALASDLRRFMRAARDGARLRAALRRRAHDLEHSRARLASAADDERRRLVTRMEAGPIRRLEAVADDLCTRAPGFDWTARISLARVTLDDLVAGLGPVGTGDELVPALGRLARASGASFSGPVGAPDVDPAAARAIWFACSEALANARKHAPGAHITVRLEATDALVLTVSDDGPGGADPHGPGLAGLAGRLSLLGGDLEVLDVPVGTTVVARVPLAPRCVETADDVLPLMPSKRDPATVET